MLMWNVYYEDFNAQHIKIFNIFDHQRFVRYCVENIQKNNDEFSFEQQLRSDLQYLFWSKCEWECLLGSWPESKKFNKLKISVYDQINLNWDRFVEYVWANKELLK